jgi:OmpA family
MHKTKRVQALVTTLFCIATMYLSAQRAYSHEFNINGIFFNENMPLKNSDLRTSLVSYNVSLQMLKNDLGAINSLDSTHFIKIIGRTDDRECNGDECMRLSLRRAQMVYQWMIDNGVPRSRFLPPEGLGSGSPLDNNGTSQGRARNRLVEFLIVPSTP